MKMRRLVGAVAATGLTLGLFAIAPPIMAQSLGSVSPTLIPNPSLQCDVTAGNPHGSNWWYDNYGELKVDAHALGACNEAANQLQDQAILKYWFYIGDGINVQNRVYGNKSKIVFNKTSVTSPQAYIGCTAIVNDQYTAGGLLWVNGSSSPQDAAPNTMNVPCVPPPVYV